MATTGKIIINNPLQRLVGILRPAFVKRATVVASHTCTVIQAAAHKNWQVIKYFYRVRCQIFLYVGF
jgi:hypothetical protein